MIDIAIPGGNAQGPLAGDFGLSIPDGYAVLIGANNSGKSSILQAAFRHGIADANIIGPNRICLIPPERMFVASSIETTGRSLENYNNELNGSIGGSNIPYETFSPMGPSRNELFRLLLDHQDSYTQRGRLLDYLKRLGLSDLVARSGGRIIFDDVSIVLHGSGLRCLLTMLAALTDPLLTLILIDEPELSLEPKLQKALRDLLLEHAATQHRTIVVSTHSHLFLNREQVSHNIVVYRRTDNNAVVTSPIGSAEHLYDITFDLLGSSPEDLFSPGNFLIVEGASDQTIADKVWRLLKSPDPKPKIKVVAAGGVTKVGKVLSAVAETLRPLVLRDSPYARRVVALVDNPGDNQDSTYCSIKKYLTDRLVELPEPSLEEYLDERLYLLAGRNKADDIAALKQLGKGTAAWQSKRGTFLIRSPMYSQKRI